MRRSLAVLTIAASLSVYARVHAADDLVVSRFGDYLESLRSQAGIPGLAVTLIRPGEPDWERGLGLQDVERSLPARPDTPFQIDASTQLITAALVLRCVEEGRLSLDDRIAQDAPDSPDPNATLRQLLSHTSGAADRVLFSYNPARLDPIAAAIAACTGIPFRPSVADLLDRMAMTDSVPGADVIALVPPTGDASPEAIARYQAVLARLAKPYAVDAKGRPVLSQDGTATLTPAGGLISTARDLARFDAALRQGVLVQPESLALAWTPPVGVGGQPLPHGIGWFVQTYNGKRIVWQFGVGDNASSSIIITIPARGITLILLANSQGLARPLPLAAGDITVSPFARVFLSLFAR